MTSIDFSDAVRGQSLIGFDTSGARVERLATPKLGACLICFVPGTLIRTEEGETAVESLRIGDTVVTFDGSARKVVWVGKQSLAADAFRSHEALPVRFHAGSLGEGVPARDLTVSPGHCMYIDGLLVQAGHLVNGTSIVRIEPAAVDLYHVELETHGLVIAEGAPTESYLDVGNRGLAVSMDHSANGPRLAVAADAQKCAPQIDRGPALTAIRDRLAARMESMGLSTRDPGLHVLVDGRRVEPQTGPDGRITFPLGDQPGKVRIVSRSSVPRDIQPDHRDERLLGVALSHIGLQGKTWSMPVDLRHPLLEAGFHDAEDGFRWTDGDAVLPVGALVTSLEAITLHLRVAHLTTYRAAYSAQRPVVDSRTPDLAGSAEAERSEAFG